MYGIQPRLFKQTGALIKHIVGTYYSNVQTEQGIDRFSPIDQDTIKVSNKLG